MEEAKIARAIKDSIDGIGSLPCADDFPSYEDVIDFNLEIDHNNPASILLLEDGQAMYRVTVEKI